MSSDTTYHFQDDHTLLALVAEGDETAFRQLFHQYTPEFIPVITHIIKVEAAVGDVIQEIFLRVWLNREKLSDIRDPRAWLFRIMYFQSYTWLRKKAARDKAGAHLSVIGNQTESSNVVEEQALLKETSKLIRQAIDQLPPQAQKIYRLSRETGLSISEIAEKEGLASKTIRNTISRALQFIRNYLERNGITLSIILLWHWLF